jgi:hypothetical protein
MTDAAGRPGRTPALAEVLVRRSAQIAWVRNSGMSVLLLLLAFVVFVLPAVLPFGSAWQLIIDVVLLLILVSGVIAVAEHRKLALALSVLSVLVIVVRGMEWFTPVGLLPTLRNASTLSALLLLAIAVGINVFASGHAIGDRVFGAIVLYLLLGLIWGVTYAAIGAHAPGSFAGHPGADRGLADWVYFSFVTLTTVGYGDITPVATGARSLAMLEALVGQLYPAIIIARLVSLQGSSQ